MQVGELEVGTYNSLYHANKQRGITKSITPHHGPSDAYMQNLGIYNYSHGRGITINLDISRHIRTRTFGNANPIRGLTPRDELARDIVNVRNILRQDNIYNSYADQQLQRWIAENKRAFPHIFNKK